MPGRFLYRPAFPGQMPFRRAPSGQMVYRDEQPTTHHQERRIDYLVKGGKLGLSRFHARAEAEAAVARYGGRIQEQRVTVLVEDPKDGG